MKAEHIAMRNTCDFDAAFEAMTREGAEVILTFPDGLIHRQAKLIAEFAGRRRIPIRRPRRRSA